MRRIAALSLLLILAGSAPCAAHPLTSTPTDLVCADEASPELARIQVLRAHLEEYRQVFARVRESGQEMVLADNAEARTPQLAQVREAADRHENALRLGREPELSWEYLREQYDSFITSMNRQLVQVTEPLQAIEITIGPGDVTCRSPKRTLSLCPMVSGRICLFLHNSLPKETTIRISARPRPGLIVKPKEVRLFGKTMLPVLLDVVAAEGLTGRVDLDIQSGAKTLTVPVEITSMSWVRLQGTVVDAATGKRVACRVQIKSGFGTYYHPADKLELTMSRSWDQTFHTRYPGERFFYCDGEFDVRVPRGKVQVRIVRGFEHEVLEEAIEAKTESTLSRTFSLKRFVDMPAQGWYGGMTHIHFRQLPANKGWHILPDAEGLNVAHVLTYKHFGIVHSDDYPIGKMADLSRKDYFLSMGEEYRHEPYGHLCFVNIRQMVEPISTGKLGGPTAPDYPPNAYACDEAHRQGGTTIYAHFGGSLTFPGGTEMPVDAALGKLDCAEIMGAGGGYEPWYKLLNCGIRMAAAAGPDWWIEDCPRSYVYCGKQLTYEKWIDGLQRGRNFVTNGPLLFFTADKRMPGDEIRFGPTGGAITVSAKALNGASLKKLEIIKDGEAVEEVESVQGARELSLARTIKFAESGWLAARCTGEGSAHSSPIYVMVGEQPTRWAKDAAACLETVNKIIEWVTKHGRFDAERHRQEVLRLFEKGRAFYEGIVRSGRGAVPPPPTAAAD